MFFYLFTLNLQKNYKNISIVDSYLTIEKLAEGTYSELRSKFLAFAYPVQTVEEVKARLATLQKKYYDARHSCYAYRIGAEGEVFRTNDAGEPSGTAGRPILGQLVSRNLTNVMVAVVRYFGGVKLGTSRLGQAYKTAAAAALDAAVVVERTIDECVTVQFPYESLNKVMRIVKDLNPQVISQDFQITCSMTLSIRKDQAPALLAHIEQVDGLYLV